MAKSKNLQNKNTVSGNKTETNATNCGKNQNSAQNKTTSSYQNTDEKNKEERDEY